MAKKTNTSVETTETMEIAPVINSEPETGAALVEQTSTPNDLENFYEEDGQDESLDYIPTLKIAQKGEFLGQLYCPDMEQAWETMNVALLRVTNSRVLWPEDFNKENMPLCRSHNGVTPAGDIPEDPDAESDEITLLPPMAKTCKNCPYAKWGKGKTPPRCLDVRDLLLIDLETSIPFFYSVYSIALSPYNQKLKKPLLMRKMSLTAQRKRSGLSPAHISMFSFDLSTELDSRTSGDAYKPVFSDITELDDEMKFFTGTVAMQLKNYTKKKDLPVQGEESQEEDIESEVDDF